MYWQIRDPENTDGPRNESIKANIGDQLFQNRGALGIGDAVKVLFCGLEVRNVRDDRVRCGQLVLHISPGFALAGEIHPCSVPIRSPVYTQVPM